MKIGITYNLRSELSPSAILDSEFCEEFDNIHTIEAIASVFQKNGHETVNLGSGVEIVEKIKNEKVEFVFNIAEGYSGRNRESAIPSLLEMMNIPYSGSDPLTLGLTLDKVMSKKIAFNAGIPTPKYHIINESKDVGTIEKKLNYPIITKPAWEGSSKGIYNSSKVYNIKALEENVEVLFKKYPDQPIIAEEYIEGKEITVGVIGNKEPAVLGIMEIINKKEPGKDFFYSLEVKRDWENLVEYRLPEDMGELLDKHLRYYAIMAFKEFGCRDISRIDFRISENNKIYFLEVNPLPGLSPQYADLVIMAGKAGIHYDDLVMSILNNALSRYKSVKDGSRINYEKI